MFTVGVIVTLIIFGAILLAGLIGLGPAETNGEK